MTTLEKVGLLAHAAMRQKRAEDDWRTPPEDWQGLFKDEARRRPNADASLAVNDVLRRTRLYIEAQHVEILATYATLRGPTAPTRLGPPRRQYVSGQRGGTGAGRAVLHKEPS